VITRACLNASDIRHRSTVDRDGNGDVCGQRLRTAAAAAAVAARRRRQELWR